MGRGLRTTLTFGGRNLVRCLFGMEVKSRMQAIDFYCKKCRKSMRISYALIGDRTAPVMNGIMIKCHTHKCTRVVTLKNFTEGQIVERTDALGKCYL